MPRTIGTVISIGKASLRELETFYSVEDCYDLIEIATVDAHNSRLIAEQRSREEGSA